MYTSLFYELLGFKLYVCEKFGAIPFHWNKKGKCVYSTKRSILKCRCHVLAISMHMAWIGLRMLQMKLVGTGAYRYKEDFHFIIALFLCSAFVIPPFCPFFLNPDFSQSIANASLSYARKFHQEWMPQLNPNKLRQNWYLDRFVAFSIFLQFVGPLVVWGHFCLNPRSAVYPTSIIPEGEWFTLLSYLAYGLCYLWGLYTVWGNMTYFTVALMSYFCFVCPILANEFMPNRKSYKTGWLLRTPYNLPIVYKTFEILMINILDLIGVFILPTQGIVTQLILFCNYTLIKRWDTLDGTTKAILLIWSTGGLMVWTSIIMFGGWMNSQGKKILKSWKYFDWVSKKDLKYISKVCKSCRPLSVRVGGFYCVKKLTVLKFFRGITRGTFRALATLK